MATEKDPQVQLEQIQAKEKERDRSQHDGRDGEYVEPNNGDKHLQIDLAISYKNSERIKDFYRQGWDFSSIYQGKFGNYLNEAVLRSDATRKDYELIKAFLEVGVYPDPNNTVPTTFVGWVGITKTRSSLLEFTNNEITYWSSAINRSQDEKTKERMETGENIAQQTTLLLKSYEIAIKRLSNDEEFSKKQKNEKISTVNAQAQKELPILQRLYQKEQENCILI